MGPDPSDGVTTWAAWALDVAASINPVESGAFLVGIEQDA